MVKNSVLTNSEKEEAAAEAMLRAAARKGFNQGLVMGAFIAALTSVICTAVEHYMDKKEEMSEINEDDEDWPF